MKHSFFQAAVMLILLYGCTIWTLTKHMEKKLDSNYTCCKQYWKSPGGNTPQNSSYMATYHPSWKVSMLDEPDMRDTAGEVSTSSYATYSCGPLHIDEQRQDDQLEPIYNSSVLIQDVAWKTFQERWTIETGGERGSERSVLPAQHDDKQMSRWQNIQVSFFMILCFFSIFPDSFFISGSNWDIYIYIYIVKK